MHAECRRPTATAVPPVAVIIAGIMRHAGGVQTAIIDINERKETGIIALLVLLTAFFYAEFAVVVGAIWPTSAAALCIAGTPFIFDWICAKGIKARQRGEI